MNFDAPHFENPGRLWLTALVVLGLAGVFVYAALARRQQLAAFADPSLLDRLLSTLSPVRRAVKLALILLAVAFLGIAFARPQWGEEKDTNVGSGEDTIFVLDTSKSMLATDVRPNRLERAKLAIQDYLRRHAAGRVGLVVFAGQAFLQCPLTLDYDAFSDTLRSVDVNAVPVPGSDLARALDEAARALEKNEGRRLIVLLTDGEDLAGAGVKSAQDLAKKKVCIYTVGVGTTAGTLVQVPADGGGLRPQLDGEGRPVVSRLDEKTLRAIAEATGGQYQMLGTVGDGMDKVRQAVTNLTASQREALVRTRGIDRYHWPLGIALGLLLIEPLLRERRMNTRQLSCLLLAALATTAGAKEVSPREAYNQGVESLKKGHLREAESWLLRSTAAQRESIQPPALYDLGHVRFKQGGELLKGESPRQPLVDRADNANDDGVDATLHANRALKKDQLEDILSAYLAGRPIRKQLRLAHEDVQRALDLYGAVLVRWRRSVGDFRSSDELRHSEDAEFNARTVERHIEELLKHVKELEQQKGQIGETRAELKKKMAELKGKIPDELKQPGQGDEDEDEDEEPNQPKPEPGMQRQGEEGEKRGITPEIAQQILEALGLKGDRKLPIGGDEPSPSRDRKGKDW